MTQTEKDRLVFDIRMKRNKAQVIKDGPHEASWWTDVDHPERMALVTEVIGERDPADESEDEKGNKIYVKERCPKFH